MINQLKTIMLLSILTALLLFIGSLFSTSGLIVAILLVLVMNLISYFYSDKIVLFMYRAKLANESDYPELYSIVREVVHLAKIPMPKVYILPSPQANAFATGRNPSHAAIACTDGILKILTRDELTGVIAHEISHISNRDTLIMTVAGTIAGIISYVSSMVRFGAIFGGYNNDRNNNLLELLVLAILAPLIAMILQLAISRSREYLADESAAKIIKNPLGLANALEKLENSAKHESLGFGNTATSSLFIVNPFTLKGIFTLFSTHPATKDRINRLKDMKV